MTAGTVPHWDEYRAAAGASGLDACVGLLGDQIASHGECVQAVGPGAALGAARASGMVARYQRYDESTLPSALATRPLTLIDVGPIRDPADINPKDETRPSTSRAQQVAVVGARAGAVLKVAPAGQMSWWPALADAGDTERLAMIAMTGPHFGGGTLESGSTRTLGLVQLTDLTPTVLQHLGIPRPSKLGGTPLQFVPAQEVSDHFADQRLRTLLDYDQASHSVRSLVEPFFYGWVLLQLALYRCVALLWKHGWATSATPARHSPSGRHCRDRPGVDVPGQTSAVVALLCSGGQRCRIVGLFAAAISALALLGPWRYRLFGPLVVVCTTTMAVLTLEVMTGSRLQLSSLMSLQPVVGGRFCGMGSVAFAVFATPTLRLCTAVGHLASIGRTRYAAAAVASIGMGALLVDVSAPLGGDLGVPAALLPGVVLLVLAILAVRLTWRLILAIAGGVWGFLVLLGLLGLLDRLRPAQSRSLLG